MHQDLLDAFQDEDDDVERLNPELVNNLLDIPIYECVYQDRKLTLESIVYIQASYILLLDYEIASSPDLTKQQTKAIEDQVKTLYCSNDFIKLAGAGVFQVNSDIFFFEIGENIATTTIDNLLETLITDERFVVKTSNIKICPPGWLETEVASNSEFDLVEEALACSHQPDSSGAVWYTDSRKVCQVGEEYYYLFPDPEGHVLAERIASSAATICALGEEGVHQPIDDALLMKGSGFYLEKDTNIPNINDYQAVIDLLPTTIDFELQPLCPS